MIKFENVSFCYEEEILHNINLTFPSTGLIVIIGKSGSGKSTILSLLNGAIKPSNGKIINEMSISTLFQNDLLLDYLTALENVMFPLLLDGYPFKDAKNIALEKIKEVDFNVDYNKYPITLSGGEKMKIALARALIKETDCLLLDEPTGQLDDKSSLLIYDLLKKLAIDRLLILVTHDEKNGCEIADRLYHLDGKNLLLLKDNLKEKKNNADRKNENIKKNKMNSILSICVILLKYFKLKKIRLFASVIFLSILLSVLYFGLYLKFDIDNIIYKVVDTYYDNDIYSLQYKDTVSKEDKVSIERYSIPDYSILKSLGIKNYFYSLGYFIPEYYSLNINDKDATVKFLPVFTSDDNKIKVNNQFIKAFNINDNKMKEVDIDIKRMVTISSSTLKKHDDINIDLSFQIDGYVEEVSLFNEPTIYYNYEYIIDYLSSINLINISSELKEDVTVKDLLDDIKYDRDDFKNHEIFFQNDDIKTILENSKILYADRVSIKSKALTFSTTLKTIISSIEKVFSMFLILSLMNAVILEILCTYSLYNENIRLFLLTKMNSNRGGVIKLTIANAILFSLITLIIFSFFSILITIVINILLNNFSMGVISITFNIYSFLIIFFINIVLSVFTSLLPLKRIKKKAIMSEIQGNNDD